MVPTCVHVCPEIRWGCKGFIIISFPHIHVTFNFDLFFANLHLFFQHFWEISTFVFFYTMHVPYMDKYTEYIYS
jgi:hypothetical protein